MHSMRLYKLRHPIREDLSRLDHHASNAAHVAAFIVFVMVLAVAAGML